MSWIFKCAQQNACRLSLFKPMAVYHVLNWYVQDIITQDKEIFSLKRLVNWSLCTSAFVWLAVISWLIALSIHFWELIFNPVSVHNHKRKIIPEVDTCSRQAHPQSLNFALVPLPQIFGPFGRPKKRVNFNQGQKCVFSVLTGYCCWLNDKSEWSAAEGTKQLSFPQHHWGGQTETNSSQGNQVVWSPWWC